MAAGKKQGYINIIKYLIMRMPKTSFAAIFIVISCAVFRNFFTEGARLVICVGSFILCGYNILIGAADAIKHRRFLHPDIYLTVSLIGTFVIGMYYEAVFAAAVFDICRAVLEVFREWAEHKYAASSYEDILLSKHKSATEKRQNNAVAVFSVVSLICIIALTVLIPVFWRVPIVSWLRRAFILLAAACPGAITVASSIEYFKCLNTAYKQGIIFRSRNTLEEAAKVTSLVFGKIEIEQRNKYNIEYIESPSLSKSELLILAAYGCSFEDNEIFNTVVRDSGISIDLSKIEMYKVFPGRGTAIILGGVKLVAGNFTWMKELKIDTGDIPDDEMSVYIAANGKFAGRIKISESEDHSVSAAITKLSEIDFDRIIMLTSSPVGEAYATAKILGIEEIWADLSFEERKHKLTNLREMQLENEHIAFVAENISDTELVKTADIGISIGESASVLETDIHIKNNDYSKIAESLKLSRTLVKNIKRNYLIACVLKGLSVALALIGFAGIWSIAVIDTVAAVLVLKGKKDSDYI